MTDLTRLIDLLLPIVETVAERRALLREALGARSPLLGDITRDGAPREFLVNALAVLAREFDALDALLDVAKDRVGTDAAAQIEALRPALYAWAKAGADVTLFAPRPLSAPDQPVFLSYSRVDRDRVVGLYKELSEAGIPLWRDVHDIPADSPNWWGEIRAAIDACSSMVLCLSLHALRSTVVSDEWNYARKRGKRVIPVIVDEVFNHPDVQANRVIVPLWMRTANWVDLRPDAPERATGFSNLLKTLRMPYTPRPTHITVKASQLPHNFVPRSREFESLVEALAVSPPTEAGTTVALTAALRGAGGYGKTTLAKALCRDWRVSGAYPDGIHWVTLGEKLLELSREVREAELVARLLDLVKEITGERPNVARLDAAQEELKKAVEDRRLLIVIDDAWAAAHVRPFLAPGRYCAIVITTRFDECVPRSGAVVRQRIDQMDKQDALALLSFGVEGWERERAWFEEVAFKRLGRSAQLLGIINSAITDQLAPDDNGRVKPLAEVLADVKARLDYYGVTAFQPESPEEREQAFGRTLEVGIERLRSEEQARYRSLGIFPQDVPIPLTMLAALWGLDPIPTQDFCEKLAKSSLVQDYDERTLTVHDVTLKYLRGTLADAPDVHARLLNVWGEPLSSLSAGEGAGVRGLPDDYAWRWYGYHLVEAGRADRLRELLLDYRWLEAKLDATDVKALIADCERLSRDETVYLIKSALKMSAHLLIEDKTQLGSQLVGRLAPWRADRAEIMALTDAFMENVPGLYPAFPDSEHTVLNPAGGALERILLGHEKPVTHVALKADGTRAISASKDGTLIVWDLASGEVLYTLDEDIALKVAYFNVIHLALIVNETQAVCIWRNGVLIILDLISGRPLRILSVDVSPRPIEHAALSLDGKQAILGLSHMLVVLSLESGNKLKILSGHTGYTGHVALTADGKRAVSASWDKTLIVWDLKSGEVLHTLRGHTDVVIYVALTSDGKRAVSAAKDKTLIVWDLESGKILHTLRGHTGVVTYVALTADGKRAVSASWDKTLIVWDLESGKALRTLSGHEYIVNYVALTQDGRRAVSASWDKTLIVWDLESGKALRTLHGHADEVNHVALTADGKHAVSASRDKTLIVWDLESPVLPTLRKPEVSCALMGLMQDGRYAILVARDGALIIWDLVSGQKLLHSEIMPNDYMLRLQAYQALKRALNGFGDLAHSAQGMELVVKDSILAVSAYNGRKMRFIADAGILSAALGAGNVIVAGDETGRVLFLRWHRSAR